MGWCICKLSAYHKNVTVCIKTKSVWWYLQVKNLVQEYNTTEKGIKSFDVAIITHAHKHLCMHTRMHLRTQTRMHAHTLHFAIWLLSQVHNYWLIAHALFFTRHQTTGNLKQCEKSFLFEEHQKEPFLLDSTWASTYWHTNKQGFGCHKPVVPLYLATFSVPKMLQRD